VTKEPRNRIAEPFILVLLAIVVFAALSYAPSGFSVKGFNAKPVNLFSEVSAGGRASNASFIQPVVSDERMKQQRKLLSQAVHSQEIIQFGPDSLGGLIRFFMALEELKKKGGQTRIAYFGDSMIEGDLITQDLRKCLQDKFGGSGVGFLPITSIVAGFRTTVRHTFSTNWTDHNLLENDSHGHGPGISGHTFIPTFSASADSNATGGSWVKYTAVNQPRLSTFPTVRMFYGAASGTNYVNINSRSIRLDGTQTVNQLKVANSAVQSINASFSCSEPIDIYGFSMDSDSGVIVDNFNFRGNSGLPLTKMPLNVLRGLDNYLGYDLVIVHYGVNVVNHKLKDYNWYEKGMVAVVNHLKTAFPGASVLVISTGDKGYRQNGKITTDPAVPLVVEAEKNVAAKTNSAFWNLYEAMGGYESMGKWVDGDTAYANKDYTHFNFRGARRVGKLLYDKLISEYDRYQTTAH
jgi:hypothetical protein